MPGRHRMKPHGANHGGGKNQQKAKTQSRGKGFDLPQQDIPRGIALHFFQHIFLACGQGVEYDTDAEHKGRNEQEIKRQFGRQKPFVGCGYGIAQAFQRMKHRVKLSFRHIPGRGGQVMLLRLHEWIDGGILKQRGQMQRHSSRLLCSGKELVRFQPHAPFPGRNGKKAVGMAGLIVAVQWLVPIQLRVAVHNVCADFTERSIYLSQKFAVAQCLRLFEDYRPLIQYHAFLCVLCKIEQG